VAGAEDDQNRQDEKAERRAARERITAYHRDQLRILLEHVRSGFAGLEAGEIDEFELDDLIFHYKQSAKELWKFCELPRNALQAASAIDHWRQEGTERDWWEAGEPQRHRSS
jgi:hypothetical protein